MGVLVLMWREEIAVEEEEEEGEEEVVEIAVEQEEEVYNEDRDSGMETDGEMELFPEE